MSLHEETVGTQGYFEGSRQNDGVFVWNKRCRQHNPVSGELDFMSCEHVIHRNKQSLVGGFADFGSRLLYELYEFDLEVTRFGVQVFVFLIDSKVAVKNDNIGLGRLLLYEYGVLDGVHAADSGAVGPAFLFPCLQNLS